MLTDGNLAENLDRRCQGLLRPLPRFRKRSLGICLYAPGRLGQHGKVPLGKPPGSRVHASPQRVVAKAPVNRQDVSNSEIAAVLVAIQIHGRLPRLLLQWLGAPQAIILRILLLVPASPLHNPGYSLARLVFLQQRRCCERQGDLRRAAKGA